MDGSVCHEMHSSPEEGLGPGEEKAHPGYLSTRLAPLSWGFCCDFRTTFGLSLLGIWAVSVCTTGRTKMKEFIIITI